MADDATWYEGRTLHPDATRHDGADPDATRHEGTRPDPDATRHEGRQDGTPVGLARFGHLPPRLASRFDFVRALSTAGGQADIVLCRDRASGEEVAVKIYRGHPQIDHAMYDKLRLVEAAHVAPTLELHTDAEATWEVQEYFRFGSLHDLLRERGDGAQRPQFVRAVVVELAAALRALHAEGISHRDLKPGNVFVRSVDPLDLVLGDFGFARDLAMSSEYMSVVGVFHYTAPEVALGGLASPAGDWWALGIIVYELLTGHSLFLDDAGRREANQYRVRGALDQGAYSIAEVTDPRWHLLLRGLLNSDRKNRWSDGQVDAWLAGASPEVVEAPPARVVRRAEPFTTPWGTFTEPDQALAAMIPDWDAPAPTSRMRSANHSPSGWPPAAPAIPSLEWCRPWSAMTWRLAPGSWRCRGTSFPPERSGTGIVSSMEQRWRTRRAGRRPGTWPRRSGSRGSGRSGSWRRSPSTSPMGRGWRLWTRAWRPSGGG